MVIVGDVLEVVDGKEFSEVFSKYDDIEFFVFIFVGEYCFDDF